MCRVNIVSLQMLDDVPGSLEGDMTIPSKTRNTSQPGAPDFYTLDEPIKETIVRIQIGLNSMQCL